MRIDVFLAPYDANREHHGVADDVNPQRICAYALLNHDRTDPELIQPIQVLCSEQACRANTHRRLHHDFRVAFHELPGALGIVGGKGFGHRKLLCSQLLVELSLGIVIGVGIEFIDDQFADAGKRGEKTDGGRAVSLLIEIIAAVLAIGRRVQHRRRRGQRVRCRTANVDCGDVREIMTVPAGAHPIKGHQRSAVAAKAHVANQGIHAFFHEDLLEQSQLGTVLHGKQRQSCCRQNVLTSGNGRKQKRHGDHKVTVPPLGLDWIEN